MADLLFVDKGRMRKFVIAGLLVHIVLMLTLTTGKMQFSQTVTVAGTVAVVSSVGNDQKVCSLPSKIKKNRIQPP